MEQYEIPAYVADSKYVYPNGTKFLDDPVDETVYSIFIGTNDLGNYAFISDAQVPGTTIVNYTDCVFNAIQRIYDNGGRYFVLQNVAPLQLSPQYGLPGKGGLASTQYWPEKPSNITEISYKMLEYVSLVNNIFKYETPYLTEVANRYPGAQIAVMDINGLVSGLPTSHNYQCANSNFQQLTDIYNNPSKYLNGTAPLDVTGYANSDGTGKPANPDSFMWYDELHPSEQTDRVIAREFVDVVKGNSKWATYWSDC